MNSLAEHFEAILTAAGVVISGLLAVLGWFIRGEITGIKKRQDEADKKYSELFKTVSEVQLKITEKLEVITDRLSNLEGAHSAATGDGGYIHRRKGE